MNKYDYSTTPLVTLKLSSEELLIGSYNEEIIKRLNLIIQTEAPIYSSLLKKRLLNSFSLKKCGSRLEAFLIPLLADLSFPKSQEKSEFVFFKDNTTCDYFRPSLESVRYSYQIPYIEGSNAISKIYEEKGKINQKALLEYFCEEFGYKRKGSQVIVFFKGSLDYYKKHKKLS